MFLIQTLILLLILFFAIKINKPKKSVVSFEPNYFIKQEPVFQQLPKGAIRNSHWFVHTFMRTRKKG